MSFSLKLSMHNLYAHSLPTFGADIEGVWGFSQKKKKKKRDVFITYWLGLKMPEIPFPRASVLKILQGKMPLQEIAKLSSNCIALPHSTINTYNKH